MNALKRDIIKDGLVNYPSLLGVCGGISALLVAVAGGGILVGFVGFAAILGGAGWSVTNLALNYESIKAKILADRARVVKAERDKRLDDLDDRLILDKDPRDQGYLREIRHLYDELCQGVAEGRVDAIHIRTVLPQIDQLFEACVKELERSYQLWETQRLAKGKIREKLREQRETIITSVGESVGRFSEVVSSLLVAPEDGSSIEAISRNLDNSLAIAKRVEERMKEFDIPLSTRLDFERY